MPGRAHADRSGVVSISFGLNVILAIDLEYRPCILRLRALGEM